MPHTVTYNEQLHIIETRTHGEVTFSESKEIISEIIQTAVVKNCFLCLGDYREETMKLSTLELHDIPKIISNSSITHGISAHKFKRAIVVARDLKDFHFFETVTLNNGQTAKLFQDIDEAKKWLLEK